MQEFEKKQTFGNDKESSFESEEEPGSRKSLFHKYKFEAESAVSIGDHKNKDEFEAKLPTMMNSGQIKQRMELKKDFIKKKMKEKIHDCLREKSRKLKEDVEN